MEKPMSIIRPWKGGLNDYSLHFTIPAEIVKTMGITEDTHLTIKIQGLNDVVTKQIKVICEFVVKRKSLHQDSFEKLLTVSNVTNLLCHYKYNRIIN